MAGKPLDIEAVEQVETRAAAEGDELDSEQNLVKQTPADRFVEDVYICFGKEDSDLPKDAIQLILKEGALRRTFPWSALLVTSKHDGKLWTISRVCVEIYHKGDRLPAEIEASLVEAAQTKSSIKVPDDWQLYTWFYKNHDYRNFVGSGPWRVEQVLRSVSDLAFARATGYKPAWYDVHDHGALFEDLNDNDVYLEEDLEDAYSLFSSAEFKRGSDGQRLARRLEQIQPGHRDARAFQHWVAAALIVLFPEGLTRVRTNPNPAAPLQRDVVATNTKKGSFFERLYHDYDVSMVVFEAKNYARADPADFGQVQRYLGAQHYGSLGFLVVHAPTQVVPEASWRQMRTIYNEDGKRKLVIVLPSAFLVELLDNLWSSKRGHAEEAMELWLEEALLNHLHV